MYGYIYKATNLKNGRFYIGKKVSTIFVKSYYCSGLLIKISVKKNGVQNFKVELICKCYSKKQLCAKEIYWIKQLNSQHPNGYNIHRGGEGGPITESTRLKISKKITGTKDSVQTRKKKSKSSKERWQNKTYRDKVSKAVSKGRKNIIFTEAHINNLSIAQNKRFKKQKERDNISKKNKIAWKKKKKNKLVMKKLRKTLQYASKHSIIRQNAIHKVYQFDENKKLINKYSSLVECFKITHIYNLPLACRAGLMRGGFYFSYSRRIVNK